MTTELKKESETFLIMGAGSKIYDIYFVYTVIVSFLQSQIAELIMRRILLKVKQDTIDN